MRIFFAGQRHWHERRIDAFVDRLVQRREDDLAILRRGGGKLLRLLGAAGFLAEDRHIAQRPPAVGI